MKPLIKVVELGKKYGNIDVFKAMTFNIYENELLVIMGASGAGKSTLLNILGGLDLDYEGEIIYSDDVFSEIEVPLPFVFQEFESLLPWKTVEENIKLVKKHVSEAEVENVLREVELLDHRDKYPDALSGGMKQRLGIARALICHSKVLFMDEPFGSLDSTLRCKLQDLILRIKAEREMTILFVTHDLDEGERLGDRIITI